MSFQYGNIFSENEKNEMKNNFFENDFYLR